MEENEKRWAPSPVTMNQPDSPMAGNNRIFDALKKAENERGQENMFEISERMIEREKENSKRALEELWLLKKNGREEDAKTIDMLIDYYQKKIDNVREKEERLKSIGKESVKLLDEKRKWQKDLAQIVQELEECTQEIDFLKAKQEKLRLKEKEIKEKSNSLFQKLSTNEKEVIDSLYTVIILKEEAEAAAAAPAAEPAPVRAPVETPEKQESIPVAPEETPAADTQGPLPSIYKAYKQVEQTRFPKSVVKTDRGRILGEYYYDPKVYKNARKYIFNGRYLVDQLIKGIDLFKTDETNESIIADMVLMASDIQNRITSRPNIFFEVSTNEILNINTLKELIDDLNAKALANVAAFSTRYMKKVEVLGQNYEKMLAEQLANLSAKVSDAGS